MDPLSSKKISALFLVVFLMGGSWCDVWATMSSDEKSGMSATHSDSGFAAVAKLVIPGVVNITSRAARVRERRRTPPE